jgi:hypothetical protein
MKQTSEIGFEQMDTILSDLLEQVQKTRATLLYAQASLVELALSNAKRQVQATPSTSVDGVEKPKRKPSITQEREHWEKPPSWRHS